MPGTSDEMTRLSSPETTASSSSTQNTVYRGDVIQKRKLRLLRKLQGGLNGYKNQIPGGRLTGNSLLGLDHDDPRRRRLQVSDNRQLLHPHPRTHFLNTNGLVKLRSTTLNSLQQTSANDDDAVHHVCVKVENGQSSDPRVLLTVKQIMEEAPSWDTHGLFSSACSLQQESDSNISQVSEQTCDAPSSSWSSYILRRWQMEGRHDAPTIVNSTNEKTAPMLDNKEQTMLPKASLLRNDYNGLSDNEWQSVVSDHFLLRQYQIQKNRITSMIMNYPGVSKKEARRRCFNVPKRRPKKYRERTSTNPDDDTDMDSDDESDEEFEEIDTRTAEEIERDEAALTPLGVPLKLLAPLTFVWAKFKQYPMWPAVVCQNDAYTEWQTTLKQQQEQKEKEMKDEEARSIIKDEEKEEARNIIKDEEEEEEVKDKEEWNNGKDKEIEKVNCKNENEQAIKDKVGNGETNEERIVHNALDTKQLCTEISSGATHNIKCTDDLKQVVDVQGQNQQPTNVEMTTKSALVQQSQQEEHQQQPTHASTDDKTENTNFASNSQNDVIQRDSMAHAIPPKKQTVDVFFFGDHTMEIIQKPMQCLEFFDCDSNEQYTEAGGHHYLAEQFDAALKEVKDLQTAMNAMDTQEKMNPNKIWELVNDNSIEAPSTFPHQNYHVNDIVWARIGHYPLWPGIIEKIDTKTSTSYQVFFFGDNTVERVSEGRMTYFLDDWETFLSLLLKGWRHKLGGEMHLASCEEALSHLTKVLPIQPYMRMFEGMFPPSDLQFGDEDERVRLFRILCGIERYFSSSSGMKLLQLVTTLCVPLSPLYSLLNEKYGFGEFEEAVAIVNELEQTKKSEEAKLKSSEIVNMLAASIDVDLSAAENMEVGQKCVKELEDLAFRAPGRKNQQPTLPLSKRELRKLDARIARIETEKLKNSPKPIGKRKPNKGSQQPSKKRKKAATPRKKRK